jgi:rhamnogalacturonyl hydrolase YesR
MERVGDWQLANPPPPARHGPTEWTMGAMYAGFMALDDVSQSRRFREAMFRMGESNRWQLGPRVYHADDHVVGQTYVELWEHTKDPRLLAPMKERFEYILTHPSTNELVYERREGSVRGNNAGHRYWWCDALFMGPPAWARLSAATGDPRYLDFAVREWWIASDYLYDKEEDLYFRDSTYFAKREANGKKIYWSRGNGWVMGGLVRMLQYLPKNHPSRDRFIQQYREMADKLVTLQQPDGLWRSSLLDPESYPLKETSGSGFYNYALAWGVNEGLLARAKFRPAVLKGWAALVGCVNADGKLTHVQPIGADPKKFDENATETYGVGAFLLAGSEVYRMAGR